MDYVHRTPIHSGVRRMSFEPHIASELEPESDAARARWAHAAAAHAARLAANRPVLPQDTDSDPTTREDA